MWKIHKKILKAPENILSSPEYLGSSGKNSSSHQNKCEILMASKNVSNHRINF